LVELVRQLMDPSPTQRHRGYCWFIGHVCGDSYDNLTREGLRRRDGDVKCKGRRRRGSLEMHN
jgi:hypothetical protein